MAQKNQFSFIAVRIPESLLGQDKGLEGDDPRAKELSQAIGLKLLALTSRLMEWSPQYWILDLTPCHRYWRHQARKQGGTIEEIVKKKLESILGEGVCAAWTDHPWRSVLLATYMEERRLRGMMVIEGEWSPSTKDTGLFQTTEKLVRDLSWSCWWSSWEILSGHFQRLKRSQLTTLRREGLGMRKAVARLGCQSPREWASMALSSLERRFGQTISQVWRWTYHHAELPLWQTVDFPWTSFQGKEVAVVGRHLECPLREWAHLEPYLKEDFDRLCRHPAFGENEGVLVMHWTLYLEDFQEKLVPLTFRYPHRLRSEEGHHRTGCLQALYSFERYFKKEGDPLSPPSVIVGWRLSIEESLIQLAEKVDLFGEKTTLATGEQTLSGPKTAQHRRCQDLVEMENRLLVPLYGYRLEEDWTPEDSFRDDREKLLGTGVEEQKASLRALARRRPLFIYQKPVTYRPPSSAHFAFMERTMVKWWQDPESIMEGAEHQDREEKTCLGEVDFKDYYLVRESHGNQNRWVYKDSKTNQWFVQGLYA